MNFDSKKAVTFVRNSITVASLISLLLIGGQTSAAGQCKGLSDDACNQSSACGWVNGYERKDGRKVKSFCRIKTKSKVATKQVKK